MSMNLPAALAKFAAVNGDGYDTRSSAIWLMAAWGVDSQTAELKQGRLSSAC